MRAIDINADCSCIRFTDPLYLLVENCLLGGSLEFVEVTTVKQRKARFFPVFQGLSYFLLASSVMKTTSIETANIHRGSFHLIKKGDRRLALT